MHYFCGFPTNLKLFQNKKLTKKLLSSLEKVERTTNTNENMNVDFNCNHNNKNKRIRNILLFLEVEKGRKLFLII